jgi:hypothetical protein
LKQGLDWIVRLAVIDWIVRNELDWIVRLAMHDYGQIEISKD